MLRHVEAVKSTVNWILNPETSIFTLEEFVTTSSNNV